MAKRGRPYRITDEHRGVLVSLVEATPGATLEEIRGELKRRTGIEAHHQTIKKVLRAARLERRVGELGTCLEVGAPEAPRYGSTQAHRRVEPEQTDAICLTDLPAREQAYYAITI